MKTKRAFYNSVAGLSYYIVTISLGLLNQKILIDTLGIDYQGVNGLFSNILSMLSIAELGLGTTIIYHLYQPLIENDESTIIALMQFYKKCYRVIAVVILILGLLIIPFLDMVVTVNTTIYSLGAIYGFFLADSVISYLFTYKRSILIADQKNYIVISLDILYQCVLKIGQIIILWITHDFLFYLSLMLVCRLIENLILNKIADQKYTFLKNKDNVFLPKEILFDIYRKVKGAVFHKIGTFVVQGTDNILISRFLGLTSVGIYSNYVLIINALSAICSRIMTAATAGVGHMLVENDREKITRVFLEMQILNAAFVNCATVGIYCVATPMIEFIFGEKYIVSEYIVFVLAVNFYMQGMRTVYSIFKETAGILYEDRFIPLIESGVNLISSLVLLHYLEMAGIILGTIISTLILYVYTYPFLVYKKVLKRNLDEYIGELIWMTIVTFLSMISAKLICNLFSWEKLGINLLYNCFVSVVVSFGIYIL